MKSLIPSNLSFTFLNPDLGDYKFYLAFENFVCDDYVTEKFIRMVYFVVPIVLRASDYVSLEPSSTVASIS